MRKNKLLIILLLAFTIMLILSLSACNSDTSGDINNNIDIAFITCCNATEEDFQKYNNAFSNETVVLQKDGYRLMKAKCEITNKNNFAISFDKVNAIKNSEFQLTEIAADYEPTFSIEANSSYDFDIYIYVNNELTDENEILQKLNNLIISFSTYKSNQTKQKIAFLKKDSLAQFFDYGNEWKDELTVVNGTPLGFVWNGAQYLYLTKLFL